MGTAPIEPPPRWQPDLFADPAALARFAVATRPMIETALDSQATVMTGDSNGTHRPRFAGSPSNSTGFDNRGHAGPRLHNHSDLRRAQWHQSLPACEGLAARLGVERILVLRAVSVPLCAKRFGPGLQPGHLRIQCGKRRAGPPLASHPGAAGPSVAPRRPVAQDRHGLSLIHI